MRRIIAFVILAALLTAGTVAKAGEMVFADLRALAPEGTFLEVGESPVITDMSYKSENISIEITQQRVHESDVFIADVHVASVTHLRRALSQGAWGKKAESIKVIAAENRALLAMTGDYAHLFTKGLVVVNGEVIRKTNNNIRDNCLIYPDGSMVTYKRGNKTVKELMEQPLWQSFLFGPSLLKADGSPYDKFSSSIGVANPRSVLGYYSPGHFCFIVADGRQKGNQGIAMTPLSKYVHELGLQAAYNLDGGQSAALWFNGRVVNNPYKGGRALTDIVYIGE